jgi:XTP/dITP diphosphohydrolase
MSQWVLASGNAGKLAEFSRLLEPLSIDVRPQGEFGVSDADETGLSFIENAILKARHAAAATGLPALADDSGVVVDALNGEPGIYSARFSALAGGESGDSANIDYLLSRLQGVPDPQRSAHYYCLLAFVRHATDPTPLIAEGRWDGRILTERVGTGGFGYDPVFYLPAQDCTAAQMESTLKNRLSHRGQAIATFMPQLQAMLDK